MSSESASSATRMILATVAVAERLKVRELSASQQSSPLRRFHKPEECVLYHESAPTPVSRHTSLIEPLTVEKQFVKAKAKVKDFYLEIPRDCDTSPRPPGKDLRSATLCSTNP